MVGRVIAVAALAGAGDLWRKRVLDSTGRLTNPGAADGWRSVTVALPPEQVAPDGRYPGPLAELGEAVEVLVKDPEGSFLSAPVQKRTSGWPSHLLP
jgi:hypothetical protein